MEKFLKSVVKEISARKAEILSHWIEKIENLGGSYTNVDVPELEGLCCEFFDAFIEVIQIHNFSKLRIFIDKLANVRSSQGFLISEVQRAYYSFYDVLKPVIEKLDNKTSTTYRTLELVNHILINTMVELSESYHRELNERLNVYVDEIENANETLKDRSIRDALTGCYNHGYFHTFLSSELNRTLRYKRPLSIVIFDIDHFKRVNDEFGHPFGDKVLEKISSILKESARQADMVFRYGGEEFSAVLPETSREQALISAERIRKKVEESIFNVDDKSLNITISGGIEGFSEKPLEKEALISNADKALYQAKKRGRNRILLYEQKK